MATAEERLMEWLRDAHAMEEQAETMLTGTAGRLEHYPQLKAQLERHAQETTRQAEMLKSCIERRGGSTSMIKDATGKLTAMGQAMSGLFVGDEVVKATMAAYTFEHFEICSYRILIETAGHVGDMETKRVCEQILQQEEAMQAWLAQNMQQITHQYLNREQSGQTAKH